MPGVAPRLGLGPCRVAVAQSQVGRRLGRPPDPGAEEDQEAEEEEGQDIFGSQGSGARFHFSADADPLLPVVVDSDVD